MNAADVLWKLIATGVLPAGLVERACEALEVTKWDLKAARARYECPPPEPKVSPVLSKALAAIAATPHPQPAFRNPIVEGRMGRAFAPKLTYTEAGRKRAAERAFISLRVEQVKCDICNGWIESGDVVVIDRAHHVGCVV
jgi:hypothetical protein